MTIQNDNSIPKIGIVAMQGDYEAHARAVKAAGGAPFFIRSIEDVPRAEGIIIPGGESTTIGKLLVRYGIDKAITEAHSQGTPIYGTCAGMILLARRIVQGEKNGGQPTLGLMDIGVARNAFGRQVDSFEADIEAPEVAIAQPDEASTVRGVFIRAPFVAELGANVQVLARYEGKPVMVREGNIIASAFHPELTSDTRVHRYFLKIISATRIPESFLAKI